MVEIGVLREDEPVELIEGELIVVPPQGPLHSSRVGAITALLARRYVDRAVRSHSPITVGGDSLPEPDCAVIAVTEEELATRHPRGSELVLAVEVARTSHTVDRGKARVYASGGVPVYWLVDLVARRVEERTDPSADGDYRVTRLFTARDEIELPGIGERVQVAALLGPEIGQSE